MLLYSIFTFFFTVFVIIWGALVRATHSGAGCGKHWPLCNGEILPLAPQLETIIEFTHRTTSGLSAVLVVILYVLTAREYHKGTFVRSSAFHAFIFMMVEVAIGATIVLFGWVKDDTSGIRAAMIAFHLVNSFLLIGSLAAHVISLMQSRIVHLKKPLLLMGTPATKIVLVLFLLTGSAGAITALGDTLFPPESAGIAMHDYLTPGNHFLVQLRIIHPVIAVFLSLLIVLYVLRVSELSTGRSKILPLASNAVYFFLLLQLLIGPLTIYFLAPIALQLTHLGLSLCLWTAIVVLMTEIEFERY